MSFEEDFRSINTDFLGPEGLGKSAYLTDGTKINVIEVFNFESVDQFENETEGLSRRVRALTKEVNHLGHGDFLTVETESEMVEDMIEAETYKIIGIEAERMGMTILVLSKILPRVVSVIPVAVRHGLGHGPLGHGPLGG